MKGLVSKVNIVPCLWEVKDENLVSSKSIRAKLDKITKH